MTTLAKTAAGAKIFIGAANPTADPTALQAEASWQEIGEITGLGEFGRSYNMISHEPLNTRQTFKFKGGRNDGAIALDMARAPSDDGQAELIVALDSDDPFNFKVELTDNPNDGSPDAPTTLLFCAKVFSYTTNVATRNGIIGARSQIEIDGDIIETPAA